MSFPNHNVYLLFLAIRLMDHQFAEDRVVALIIASIRYGIDRDSISEYLQREIVDRGTRHHCFLTALEINEEIDAICGQKEVAIAVIVEHVRGRFAKTRAEPRPTTPASNHIAGRVASPALSQPSATVVRQYIKGSENELSLPVLGRKVFVVEEAGVWVFVEDPGSGTSGWVPRDTLSLNLNVGHV